MFLIKQHLHSPPSLTADKWSAPDHRNRCSTGCPALNGTYCWGLIRSKCPHWVEGRVGQKAPVTQVLTFSNECNVIQCMGQQSHAESRPTCWQRTSDPRRLNAAPAPAVTCGNWDCAGITTPRGFWVIRGPNHTSSGGADYKETRFDQGPLFCLWFLIYKENRHA